MSLRSLGDPKSYRPTALLFVPFKILEILIYARVETITDPLLPQEQAGFRHGRSAIDLVTLLTQDIEDSFSAEKKARAGPSTAGEPVVTPHLKSVPPHFTFDPSVAAYIQYCIWNLWPLLPVFGPSVCFLAPLLLNPGNGPGPELCFSTSQQPMSLYGPRPHL